MKRPLCIHDRVGLIHPAIDVHTLGLSSVGRLLSDCGLAVIQADGRVCSAAESASRAESARIIRDWVRGNGLTAIGFSYRLDPEDGLRFLRAFMETLDALRDSGDPSVDLIYFGGLPPACDLVEARLPLVSAVFRGDETAAETLAKFGLPAAFLPPSSAEGVAYDEARLAFGRELVARGEHLSVRPVDRSGSPRFGQRGDGLVSRVAYGAPRGLPPLMRAHVGPYLPNRREAVALFMDWARRLASSGYLDVLSIGSSQLSQSAFGLDWTGLQDGGGVPLATPEEFAEAWRAARPMLVRSYAGTRELPRMAAMLEENIDNAWHALSLWWFSRLDGRGPNGVAENLRQSWETLRFVASTGKPYEPNVPHHFAFRGADDLSYVLSGLIAAKAAKEAGVRHLVLQVMLNTPKSTWGLDDLAKARALLHLVRELEDGDFKVYLQPRGGLDYFSADPLKAKAQLAAVTALMDDIEPYDDTSPQIIHVVSYSEGYALADPQIVDESVKIVRHALSSYRALRARGAVDDLSANGRVLARTSQLISDARAAVAAIEAAIPSPYGPEGLYEIFASGFLAAPWLTELREEFPAAAGLRTACVNGAVEVVDEGGAPVPVRERIAAAAENARRRAGRAR